MPIDVQRLTTKQGPVGMTAREIDDVAIVAAAFGFPIATEGEVAHDAVVLALQLEDGLGEWNGHEFSQDRVWFYAPGSEHSGTGSRCLEDRPPAWVTVSLPISTMVPERTSGSPRRTAEQRRQWVVRDDRVHQLRTILTDVLGAAQSCRLTHEHAAYARRDIMAIASILQSSGDDAPIESTSATWITRECIALADRLGPMPSPTELANGLGVSDRWIRAAFRRTYGVSVMTFFRSRAMHRAHRELRAARPDQYSVTEVAMRWGFWHLGRFSAAYRSYFGELPSATLSRLE